MKVRRFILLAGLLVPLLAAAEPRTCLVVGVSDGDTLTARCGTVGNYEQIKVRFNGIDAPEKKQPFGERAKQALSDLVYMKEAALDCPKTDRYGRSVCRVMVAPASAPSGPKTLDAGLAMITVGMAWWYRTYAREQTPQERGQYEFAETEARAKRAGLWIDAAPVPPWDWRKERHSRLQRAG
ncbi:thermonuclease family protein [Variovorax sp. PMC12]|uniref:thermonuclease family protein n=1 Tax=Variovorax sp. PMC12 TaxID=2126319 RepID=UPI000D1212B0|nr:thermonuclease family protein [Variovorax sp. PMC12]AVQ81632.1 nuclease [Variovorax sp. PMC12]